MKKILIATIAALFLLPASALSHDMAGFIGIWHQNVSRSVLGIDVNVNVTMVIDKDHKFVQKITCLTKISSKKDAKLSCILTGKGSVKNGSQLVLSRDPFDGNVKIDANNLSRTMEKILKNSIASEVEKEYKNGSEFDILSLNDKGFKIQGTSGKKRVREFTK